MRFQMKLVENVNYSSTLEKVFNLVTELHKIILVLNCV